MLSKNVTNPLVIEAFMYNTFNAHKQRDKLTDTRIKVCSNINFQNPNKTLVVESKFTIPLMLLKPTIQPALW